MIPSFLELTDAGPLEEHGLGVLEGRDGLRLAHLEAERVPLDRLAALPRQRVEEDGEEVVDAERVLGHHQVDHLLAAALEPGAPTLHRKRVVEGRALGGWGAHLYI